MPCCGRTLGGLPPGSPPLNRRPALERLVRQARAWEVTLDRTWETESSALAFGQRGSEAVVLKVLRDPADRGPFRALERFDGHGAVRVLTHEPGAALLERLRPGTSLATLSLTGADRMATDILADVIRAMGMVSVKPEGWAGFPDAAEWGLSLRDYLAREDPRVPRTLVEEAAHRYEALCASQARTRLLHGDLHHYNVLLDARRGWLAIDPKGVIGEREYELGAALRNPAGALDRFGSPKAIQRRIGQLQVRLGVDPDRVLEWAFAQAVLAAVWEAEDAPESVEGSEFLSLATTLRKMVRS